jgi:hypothetical protein
MAIKYSATMRAASLGAIETTVGTVPKLRFYIGTPPANCAAAATGTMLVEMALPSDWMGNLGVGATTTKNGTWSGTAVATGTVGYWRLWDSAGTTCHMQGTAGASGTDCNFDNASISNGQTVTISAFTITAGNP